MKRWREKMIGKIVNCLLGWIGIFKGLDYIADAHGESIGLVLVVLHHDIIVQ